jgi:hypothetical protein
MADKRNVHTVPNPGGAGWVNKVDGAVVSKHRRKDTATQAGRSVARANRSDHYIHNLNGQIGRANSYGNDDNPPKDKNR